MECLHTILLGAYKYMFGDLMSTLSPDQKREISTYIEDFPSSGLDLKLSNYYYSLIKHKIPLIVITTISCYHHLNTSTAQMVHTEPKLCSLYHGMTDNTYDHRSMQQ